MYQVNQPKFSVILFSFACLSCIGNLITAGRVDAIDIDVNYVGTSATAPPEDKNGAKLELIFNAAVEIWERLLPEPGDHDINFLWDASIDPFLGEWDPNGSPNTIRINPDYDWYFDLTPDDHSEYDFITQDPATAPASGGTYLGGQWLYGDISTGNQSDWFNGAPPSTLEIGYRGRAISSAIENQYDLLSTVVHEIGHDLGVNSGGGPFEAQPQWVANSTAGFTKGDGGHLAARTTLMCDGCGLEGTRRLPSAVDVMAAADEHDHSTISLERRVYIPGSGSWSTEANWIGGQAPDGDSDAYIRSPDNSPTVNLTSNALARNIFVGDGGDLFTNQYTLNANGWVIVDGAGSRIVADQAGSINATEVVIQNDGQFNVESGGVRATDIRVDGGTLAGGDLGLVRVSNRLINDGEIRATGGLLLFQLDGSGNPWDLGGTTGDGILKAVAGDLAFEGQLTDTFDGELTIGANHTFFFSGTFSLGNGALMTMQGGTSEASRARYSNGTGVGQLSIAQADLEVTGFAEVEAPLSLGSGEIMVGANGQAIFREGAVISGGKIDVRTDALLRIESNTQISGSNSFVGSSGGVIEFNALTTYAGGSIQMNGSGAVARQRGKARIAAPTTISGNGTWDMDGSGGDTVWDVNDDLTLNVARLESDANHRFDGRINLNGSGTTMTVNTSTAWTMDGQLVFHDGTVVAGSAQMNVTGSINAESARIEAPVAFQTGAAVQVYAGNTLQFDGATYYQGGTFRGATLQQDGPANVTEDTTLGQNTYVAPPSGGYLPTAPYIQWLEEFNWDGSLGSTVTNISPAVTFTINAVKIDDDPANDGYDGTVNINGGTLLVNTGPRIVFGSPPPNLTVPATVGPAPWRLDGTMNLREAAGNPAVVASAFGSPMYIFGNVEALDGQVAMSGMQVLLADSGRITVHDGAELATNLYADGTVEIDPLGTLRINSTSAIRSSAQMIVNGTLRNQSTTTFTGGSFQGSGLLRQSGTAKINETITFDVPSQFESLATTTIAANKELRLNQGGTVEFNADFVGDGTLRNLPGSQLRLLDGADVGVPLVNEGTLTIGESPGSAIVRQLSQTASGMLAIEIGGTGAGEFDALMIDSDVQLGGLLDVSLIELIPGNGLFMPSPTDSFPFLSFANFAGDFSNGTVGSRVDTSDGLGSFLLDFGLSAGRPSLLLSDFLVNALPGDFDLDGDRDGKDFLVWQRGGSPNPLSSSDLADWQANFGAAGSLATSQTVPEPSTLLLAGLVVIGVLRRKIRIEQISS